VVSQEQKEGTTRKLLIYRDGKLLDITGYLSDMGQKTTLQKYRKL
jgi:hypothetical protein